MTKIRKTIRLTEKQNDELDELVKSGAYNNHSDAIREAIGLLLKIKSSKDVRKVILEVPKELHSAFEQLVTDGKEINLDDGMRNALKTYIVLNLCDIKGYQVILEAMGYNKIV